ncbi:hypothetical protein [Allosphingosinicella sp.]|uniref:hypothetical protein n=1 Tax=Allosphingosinicella sp. TaxID=2823234 RepID=UPI002F00430E
MAGHPLLPEFRLHQNVAIEGDRMVVCRVLTNVGSVAASVAPLLPEGDSYEQFATHIFNAEGHIWRDMAIGHGAWSPPPLPAAEGDNPAGLKLEPNRSFQNCERFSTPRDLMLFTLVSMYHSAGPVSFEGGRQVREGVVLSNTCLVRNRSQVVCAP